MERNHQSAACEWGCCFSSLSLGKSSGTLSVKAACAAASSFSSLSLGKSSGTLRCPGRTVDSASFSSLSLGKSSGTGDTPITFSASLTVSVPYRSGSPVEQQIRGDQAHRQQFQFPIAREVQWNIDSGTVWPLCSVVSVPYRSGSPVEPVSRAANPGSSASFSSLSLGKSSGTPVPLPVAQPTQRALFQFPIAREVQWNANAPRPANPAQRFSSLSLGKSSGTQRRLAAGLALFQFQFPIAREVQWNGLFYALFPIEQQVVIQRAARWQQPSVYFGEPTRKPFSIRPERHNCEALSTA